VIPESGVSCGCADTTPGTGKAATANSANAPVFLETTRIKQLLQT
jgi:hypothetical protein